MAATNMHQLDFALVAGSDASIKAAAKVPPVQSEKSISPFHKPSPYAPDIRVKKTKTPSHTTAIHDRFALNALISIVPKSKARMPLSAMIPGCDKEKRSKYQGGRLTLNHEKTVLSRKGLRWVARKPVWVIAVSDN
jgi:hypothetical protein